VYSERDETHSSDYVDKERGGNQGGKCGTKSDRERKKNDEEVIDEDIISPASYVFRLICDAMNENG
jgi:hypothetical protein